MQAWHARRGANEAPERWCVEDRPVLIVYPFVGLREHLALAPFIASLVDGGARPPVQLLAPAGVGVTVWKHIDLPLKTHAVPAGLRPTHPDAAPIVKRVRRAAPELALHLGPVATEEGTAWLEAAGAAQSMGPRHSAAHPPRGEHWSPPGPPDPTQHWSRMLQRLAAPLGLRLPSEPLSAPCPLGDAASEAETSGAPRVIVWPGAASRPEASVLRTACLRLGTERPVTVRWVGAPGERDALRALVAEVRAEGGPRMAVTTPKTLRTLLREAATADLLLCGSGTALFGYTFGRPTIGVFERLAPETWGPLRPDRTATALNLRGAPRAAEAHFADLVAARIGALCAD